MQRGFLCLLLAVAFLALQISARAQEQQPVTTPAPNQSQSQSQSQSADDYAFRLALYIVEKLGRSTDNAAGDPLVQAAKELLAPDKQEQIRKDIERKIGAPGDAKRATRYEKLLSKIDRKLSDKKIKELRDELAVKGRGGIGGWPWPLCVIVGCK